MSNDDWQQAIDEEREYLNNNPGNGYCEEDSAEVAGLTAEVAGLTAEVGRLRADYDRDMMAANETLVETLAERDEARAKVRRLNTLVVRKEEDNERAWTECTKFRRLFHEGNAVNNRLAAERDAEILSGQKYRELGSGIFAEINSLAEKALGHPIEAGYTAVYPVELLAAEVAKLRQACEAIAGMKVNPTDGVNWHGFARQLQFVAAAALDPATTGDGDYCA